MEPLASGSYLVISHATADSRLEPAKEAAEVERVYDRTTARARARTRDEVMALVTGLDLVEPGLVWGPLWRPDSNTGLADDPGKANMYAVVARKP
jgi:S-adenosyl methyltransferase